MQLYQLADLDVIDLQLPVNLRLVIDALINIGMVVTLISVTMPVFIFFIVPFTAGYIIILGPWTSEYPLIDAWPHTGRIDICKYALNYGKDKINALRNISLSINGGEKIAVVGRTGSGKSSLAIALLRLIEPTNGTIRIDGVDITELGLHELRARITIIPQDPILFSSTLRFNLDPFNQFADSDIWISLEACQLKEIISKQKEGLLWSIEESGKEIRITEELVYQVVRDNFKQSTTITFAHRLETIKDCDRVLVVDNGEMVEFDTPGNLLSKPDSLYRKMVMQSKS
uniref:ABC transporter domain-containing protein n=1 Tax=Heterorhabditis bacteriophora TaxID=37862 RepID=A0A1I7XIU9_HETBA